MLMLAPRLIRSDAGGIDTVERAPGSPDPTRDGTCFITRRPSMAKMVETIRVVRVRLMYTDIAVGPAVGNGWRDH